MDVTLGEDVLIIPLGMFHMVRFKRYEKHWVCHIAGFTFIMLGTLGIVDVQRLRIVIRGIVPKFMKGIYLSVISRGAPLWWIVP